MATTITYTQQGDYLLPDLKLPEQTKVVIGIFGQRHKGYLKEHHRLIYFNLLTSCKLAAYLSEKENLTEQFQAENPMKWVHKMNAIRLTAAEIVNREIIYT